MIMEKRKEYNLETYLHFIDLEKACDNVKRERDVAKLDFFTVSVY